MRLLQRSKSEHGWPAVLLASLLVPIVGGCTLKRTIEVPRGSLAQYSRCFENRGGDCIDKSKTLGILQFGKGQVFGMEEISQAEKVGKSVQGRRLKLVNEVLEDDVHAELVAFHNELLHQTDQTNPTLVISERKFKKYQKKVENASLADSWCEAELAFAKNSEPARISAYLCSYYRAYFRNGHFAQLTITEQEMVKELQRRYPGLSETEIKSLFSYLFPNGGRVFGKIGDAGLVTRTGTKYQFPSIEVTVSPFAQEPVTASEVDFNTVGADLVRIFWEAAFDAHDGLPAVSNATGVTVSIDPLRVHDPKHPTTSDGKQSVNGREFEAVEWFSNQTEGWTSVAFGRLIRGAGPIALNNEAIAVLLETLVGSIVRKVTEKATWCVFSCGVSELPPDKPSSWLSLFSDGETVKVTVKVRLRN